MRVPRRHKGLRETEHIYNKKKEIRRSSKKNKRTHTLSQTAVDEGERQPFADVRQVWWGCMQVTEARNADVRPMHMKRMPGGRKRGRTEWEEKSAYGRTGVDGLRGGGGKGSGRPDGLLASARRSDRGQPE